MNAAAKCNEMSRQKSDNIYGQGTDDNHKYTTEKQKNIQAVKSWLGIVYSPKANASAVDHLTAKDSKLEGPTEIPDIHDLKSYAKMHESMCSPSAMFETDNRSAFLTLSEMLAVHLNQTPDLHITSYKTIFAKENQVCVR